MIRLTRPAIEEDDLAAVADVLRSGQLVQGPRVAEFEARVADLVGVRHAVAVTNCTAALQLALLALDVGPGDLVVVGAYSWPATANAVELCGAQPVFVDVQPDTFNIDPAALEATLERLASTPETRRRLRAILPVHAFGQMADVRRIRAIAAAHGVPVVEDAACALGAATDGRAAGAWGTLGCFSFHPRKAVTTGEGGVVTTDDAALARRLRALRNHGLDPDAPGPDFVLPGFNTRLTEFQAALGSTQLAKLPRILDARRRLAARYDAALPDAFARGGARGDDPRHVFQSYVVLLPTAAHGARDAFLAALRARGVECQIGTWHMPLVRYYRARYGYRPGDFPVCDDVSARAVTLPLYEGMTDDESDAVVTAAAAALDDVLAERAEPSLR